MANWRVGLREAERGARRHIDIHFIFVIQPSILSSIISIRYATIALVRIAKHDVVEQCIHAHVLAAFEAKYCQLLIERQKDLFFLFTFFSSSRLYFADGVLDGVQGEGNHFILVMYLVTFCIYDLFYFVYLFESYLKYFC